MSEKKNNILNGEQLNLKLIPLRQNDDENSASGYNSDTSEYICAPEDLTIQKAHSVSARCVEEHKKISIIIPEVNLNNNNNNHQGDSPQLRPHSIAHSDSKNKFKKLKRSLSGRFRKLEHNKQNSSSSHLEYKERDDSENNNNNNKDEKELKSKSAHALNKSESKKELREIKSEKDIKKNLEKREKNQEKIEHKNVNDKESPPPLVHDNTLHNLIRRGISLQSFTKQLKKYPMVDQRDEKEQTPLHICCNIGNAEILKLLLKRGAFVNTRDMNGFTPLHCTLIANDLIIAEILLQVKGIDVSILNHQNASALHYFARIPVNDENMVHYRNVLDLLVQNGVDVNIQNKQGETALHSACLKTNIHTAAFLIERGSECNILTTFLFSNFFNFYFILIYLIFYYHFF